VQPPKWRRSSYARSISNTTLLVADVTARQVEKRVMAEQLLQFQNQLNAQQRILDDKL
jgi:hypothetical protein